VTHYPICLLEESVKFFGGVVGFWDWVCRMRLDEDRRDDGGDIRHCGKSKSLKSRTLRSHYHEYFTLTRRQSRQTAAIGETCCPVEAMKFRPDRDLCHGRAWHWRRSKTRGAFRLAPRLRLCRGYQNTFPSASSFSFEHPSAYLLSSAVNSLDFHPLKAAVEEGTWCRVPNMRESLSPMAQWHFQKEDLR
jgi:hypothetical protein